MAIGVSAIVTAIALGGTGAVAGATPGAGAGPQDRPRPPAAAAARTGDATALATWQYHGTWPNLDECNDKGELANDLFGWPYDCRAVAGGWELWLWH
ncbi:hypothetical protein [Saccharothrix algeriensis]|uniref:Secreted protein n=1 Tax=Saccharothrix algeriensis TaxID=173560 RepID=A0A8T8HYG6_9PSEU|nr:hypothetical protein [Saccharothrix algeriensis]MBM7815255.1 hypothetical protein [Saccharothrix algeriensis]QTR03478.1 hypothetical protein J7S33_32105 [Saccharothrix algeriensis]